MQSTLFVFDLQKLVEIIDIVLYVLLNLIPYGILDILQMLLIVKPFLMIPTGLGLPQPTTQLINHPLQ
jgi:hypothetical protein